MTIHFRRKPSHKTKSKRKGQLTRCDTCGDRHHPQSLNWLMFSGRYRPVCHACRQEYVRMRQIMEMVYVARVYSSVPSLRHRKTRTPDALQQMQNHR